MRSFLKSFYYAFHGIYYGFLNQRNIKIQALIGLFIIIWSFLIKISSLEFIIILFISFFVIILELINTAIEKLIDKISSEYNKKYGIIKDIMAGAVLLSAVLSVIIGIIILYKPSIAFIQQLHF